MTDYTILGIDPGSNDLGLCFMTIEAETGRIKLITTYNLNVNLLPTGDYYYDNNRINKLIAFETYITNVLLQVNPNAVAIEAPFFNSASPQAYGSLKEIVCIIQMVAVKCNPVVNVMVIEPLLVKKYVNSNYKEGKEGVKRAVEGNPLLNIFLSPTISEHEIDAVAIAYSYYLNLYPG